jgi:predicted AlkP superfamily pyrophosphatase or phosphodiesterase
MNAENENPGREFSRRQFLQRLGVFMGGAMLSACAPAASRVLLRPIRRDGSGDRPKEKLIFIAIDSLDPNYLKLNRHGQPGGRDGDWLMPNIRQFLNRAVWYPKARCFLPSMTDTNHLNALAGTMTGQTGVLGVQWQFASWGANGKPKLVTTNLSRLWDDQGRPVDTIFHAWKRRWPDSPTTFISGKGWVAEMFDTPERPAVDVLVTGRHHPAYLKKPPHEHFADPSTDEDAACDPRSPLKPHGEDPMSGVNYGLWDGQTGQLTRLMEALPARFPHDGWIVDSTLEVFSRENPDLAYILMAQTDDAGHCLGTGSNPPEFVAPATPYRPPWWCANQPEYQLVSRRNTMLFLDPMLDSIRDTDFHFGRLIAGLEAQGALKNAVVVLLSDHSMINYLHVADPSTIDFQQKLLDAHLADKHDLFAFTLCSIAGLFWRERKDQAAPAKAFLLNLRARNPQTGQSECPWWVLDRDDMRRGVEGVCLPGELYQPYLVDGERSGKTAWPDLFLFAMPVHGGTMPNTGLQLPRWLPPFLPFNGGHGSVDTLPITAAIARPGAAARVLDREIRIADLGVTAAALFGLELRSSTVGKDWRADLA